MRIIQSNSIQVTTIALEGKLLQPWVGEVKRAVAAVQPSGIVRLDLTQLTFADEPGLGLLRELQYQGVELAGRNGFLAALMDR